MRHLAGLVLGIILTPLLLYALGWGADVAADSWSPGSGSLTTEGITAAVALALAGVAIAMLARGFPRLGALVVGVAFLALNVLNLMYLPAVEAILRSWGPVRLDWTGAHALLRTGVAGMLGVVLVVSALAPRRRRRSSSHLDEDYLSYIASGPEPAWSSQRSSSVPVSQGAPAHSRVTPDPYPQPGGGDAPPAAG